MADEEIVIRFVAETSDAIKASVALRQEIDKAKEQLQEFSKQAGSSYKETARAMMESFKTERMGKIAPGLDTKEMKAAIADAKKDIAGYNASVRQALSEVQAEERKTAAIAAESANAQVAANNRVTASVRASAKARSDASKQSFKVDPMLSPEQVKAAREQIALARDKARLIMDQAKAEVAARNENSKAIKLEAEAMIAQNRVRISNLELRKQEAAAAAAEAAAVQKRAQAYRDAAAAYYAPQQAQAKANQATAQAAGAAATAQTKQAQAQQAVNNTATSAAIGQQKVAAATSNASKAAAQAAKANQQLANSQNQVTAQTGKFSGILAPLNGLLRLVFASALGITAIRAIRNFREALKEATQSAIEFQKSQFALALALREIQRRGGEVDFGKVREEIDALYNQFGVFSKKEIAQSFTDVSLRLSRFGATADQVGKIVQTALVLKMTDVENRFDSVADAAKVLATYLGSGYGEGLERAGAIAGRSADQLIAFENGMKTLYGTSITPLERAMLRIDFVFRQFSGQMKDAVGYVETAGGRIEKAESMITDASVKLGSSFIGITVKGKEAWAKFASDFATKIAPMIVEGIIYIMSFTKALGDEFEEFRDKFNVPTLDEDVAKSYGEYIEGLNKSFKDRGDIEGYNRAIIDLLDSMKDSPAVLASFKKNFPDIFAEYEKNVAGLDAALAKADASTLSFVDKQRKYANELRQEFAGLSKDFDEYFATPPEIEGPIVNVDAAAQNFQDAQDEITDILKDAEKDRLELEREFWYDMGQVAEDGIPNLISVWDSYFSQVSSISYEGTEAMQAQWEAQYGEFGDILNDALDKAADIWRDYYEDIADIGRKEMQDIADENREYQQRLADAAREERQAIADANRKYRDEEIKAERDYQAKLRRLREEFLFDLEDALRERDALQVLRLMRRYALDKKQLEEEKDDAAKQRADDHKRELEDIRRNAAEKRRELAIEHQRRLDDIRLQAERERAEAELNRQREMEALRQDIERRRAEREAEYAQEQADLEAALTERIQTILEKLVEEGELTQEQLNALSTALQEWAGDTQVGHASVATAIAEATVNIIASMQAQDAQMAASAAAQMTYAAQIAAAWQMAQQYAISHTAGAGGQGMPRVNYTPTPATTLHTLPNFGPSLTNFPSYFGYAEGGQQLAKKPTIAMFGEGGPEIATFTPVNRVNTNNKSPVESGMGNMMPGSMGGKLHLMVELSPDLEARIVDNTLDQSAEIIQTALGRRLSL